MLTSFYGLVVLFYTKDASFEVSLGSQSTTRFSVNTTDFGPDGFVFHQINVSSLVKPIVVAVYPDDVNATFDIFVRFDSTPSESEFDLTFQVSALA